MKLHIKPLHEPEHDPPSDQHAEGLAEDLARSALFDGVDVGEVRKVLAAFDEQHFNTGHRITLEGLRGSDFFVIVDGTARVSVDGATVNRLSAGDFFGELGVLGDGLRFATVTAETPLSCLVLPHGALKQLLVEHPQMSVNVLSQVVSRFHQLAGRRSSSLSRVGTG